MTTEAALHEINRTLGMMTASVDELRRDFAASEIKQDQSRANIHRRLDDLVDHVGEIEATVANVSARVAQIEVEMSKTVMPVIADVTAWKQRGVGALVVAGMAGSAFGAAIAYFWAEIIAKFTRVG